MSLPNWSYVPPRYLTATYAAGTKLCRVYNRKSAQAGGYSSVSFNPKSWAVDPAHAAEGGRFDALAVDPYGYLYASDAGDDPTVAIWETLAYKSIRRRKGSQYLPASMFNELAIRFFSLEQDIKVVNIVDQAALSFFNADIDDVTRTHDYNQSRQWGSYIRNVAAPCHGFKYTSRRLGSASNGYALVLFEDRFTGRAFRSLGNPIDLSGLRGRRLVDESLLNSNIAVEWV